MKAIIVSTQDIAGLNIKESLLNLGFKETSQRFESYPVYQYDDFRLYITDTDSIYCENIDKKIDADIFIFATRHNSASGIPLLSAHALGNWSKAEFGGQDRRLCIAPAYLLKQAIISMEKLNDLGFEVVQEVTHHGPYLEKPCIFIEIGSSEKEWKVKRAGEIIAKTIISLSQQTRCKPALGIGGLHTTPNFKKIILNTDIAIGHVCPKYMLEFLDENLILQAINNTLEKAVLVVVDWKGLGQYKEKVVKMLDRLGLAWKKTKDLNNIKI